MTLNLNKTYHYTINKYILFLGPSRAVCQRIKFNDILADMEGETIVNGSHEVETDPGEKILKPRTPKSSVVNGNDHNIVIQNGNSDSHSDVTENNEIENGYVEDPSNQNGNGRLYKENLQEIKEGMPRKLRRDSRKESTPKPETPIKRELRRRETTPRASTPKKNVMSSSDSPHKKQNEESKPQIKEDEKINLEEHKPNDGEVKSPDSSMQNESIIILEETRKEVVSINESVEVESEVTEKFTSNFSVFSKNYKSNLSSDIKDSIEASTSSPSVVCLDSSSYDNFTSPNNEIKGRKPINSFSKFPGRTVSIISLDSSTKRKADDSFDNNEKKRFAGDIESGSEKSPGKI